MYRSRAMDRLISLHARPLCPHPTNPAFHKSQSPAIASHFKTFLFAHRPSFGSGLTTNRLQAIRPSIFPWSVIFHRNKHWETALIFLTHAFPFHITHLYVSRPVFFFGSHTSYWPALRSSAFPNLSSLPLTSSRPHIIPRPFIWLLRLPQTHKYPPFHLNILHPPPSPLKLISRLQIDSIIGFRHNALL